MSKKPTKVVIKLHDQEVIDIVKELPRGYRSVVIESAIRNYARTAVGRELIENLTRRNGKRGLSIVSGGNVYKRLEGDF